jgi:hypothetical protein
MSCRFWVDVKFHERKPAALAVMRRKKTKRQSNNKRFLVKGVKPDRVKYCMYRSVVGAFDVRNTGIVQALPQQI